MGVSSAIGAIFLQLFIAGLPFIIMGLLLFAFLMSPIGAPFYAVLKLAWRAASSPKAASIIGSYSGGEKANSSLACSPFGILSSGGSVTGCRESFHGKSAGLIAKDYVDPFNLFHDDK